MATSNRSNPNILITGTPGVGKSTIAKRVASLTGMTWLDISKVARENNFLEEYDERYSCPIIDENRIIELVRDMVEQGNVILDFYSSEMFPEYWFDIVFVITTDNTTLYDRLSARGYIGTKLEQNVSHEIFRLALEEAQESYKKSIIYELDNTLPNQLDDTISRIHTWVENWKANGSDTPTNTNI